MVEAHASCPAGVDRSQQVVLKVRKVKKETGEGDELKEAGPVKVEPKGFFRGARVRQRPLAREVGEEPMQPGFEPRRFDHLKF